MTDIRLAYASTSLVGDDADALHALETESLRNNARLGVTGGLYHDKDRFFQVLEGPENAVAVIYDRVRADPRHTDIQLICRHPIRDRMFGLWSMKVIDGAEHPQLRATFRAVAALGSPSGQALDPRIKALQDA